MRYQDTKRCGGTVSAYLSERSQSEKAACRVISTVRLSGKGNTAEMVKQVSGRQVRGWEGRAGRAEAFQGSDTALYDAVM